MNCRICWRTCSFLFDRFSVVLTAFNVLRHFPIFRIFHYWEIDEIIGEEEFKEAQ